jgi:hypothetical protein
MRKTVALVGAGILTLGIAGCGGGGGTSTGAGNKTLTLGMSVVALPWDLSKIGIGYEATYDQPVYDTLVGWTHRARPPRTWRRRGSTTRPRPR